MQQYRASNLSTITPVVKNLIIINVLCWLASIALPRYLNVDFTNLFGLHYWGASGFLPFQFITYMFLHSVSSFSHLFFNMFGLFMFGQILENVWGSKRFLIFYMITGIGAGIVQELTWMIEISPLTDEIKTIVESGEIEQGVNVGNQIIYSIDGLFHWKDAMLNRFITVGASGSIFGLLLAFGMIFPNQPMYIMFIPIPIKAKYMIIGYTLIELFMGVNNFSFDNVAHFAHLGGMLFGLILILKWKHDARAGKM